jgi:RHS repeat-associated protein
MLLFFVSGSVPTDKLFSGQRLDATGLYYYNARYYDALIGRFISPDTVISRPTNPQCFNRYSYCLNNPTSRIDPSGHDDYMILMMWGRRQAEAKQLQKAMGVPAFPSDWNVGTNLPIPDNIAKIIEDGSGRGLGKTTLPSNPLLDIPGQWMGGMFLASLTNSSVKVGTIKIVVTGLGRWAHYDKHMLNGVRDVDHFNADFGIFKDFNHLELPAGSYNLAKWGTRAVVPLAVAIDVYNISSSYANEGGFGPQTRREAGSAAGGWAGAWAGAALGAAVGGPVGLVVGGLVGAIAGGLVGEWIAGRFD